MEFLRANMKGSVADMIFVGIFFVFLLIGIGAVYYSFSKIGENVFPILNISQEVSDVSAKVSGFNNLIFNLIPYVWILLAIGTIISAFAVSVSPIFIIAGIILSAINIIISYIYQQVILDFLPVLPELNLAVSNNFLLSTIISNFPMIIAVINFLIVIVMVIRNATEIQI
jgi:hypothetical protein